MQHVSHVQYSLHSVLLHLLVKSLKFSGCHWELGMPELSEHSDICNPTFSVPMFRIISLRILRVLLCCRGKQDTIRLLLWFVFPAGVAAWTNWAHNEACSPTANVNATTIADVAAALTAYNIGL